MANEPGPYCLARDEEGHHYVIPVARIDDWNKFRMSEEYELGVAPAWADSVGGSPALIHFYGYVIT